MEKHYFNMQVNSISLNKLKELEWQKSKTLFKNSEAIPEWDNIMVFQWIFSQNFKKGEKSRNGYKYDQNWWIVDNYARLPIILWQHDDNYGWIGMTQELYLDTNNNLSWIFYVDLDTLEERNAKQVKKWFVKSVSTWAITLEDWFEDNETWKVYSQEEAMEKYWFENILNALWGAWNSVLTYIVSKAELVENSLVTIWSNYWAIAKSVNTLSDEMKKKAEELKQNMSSNDETLILNNKAMKRAEKLKTNEVETDIVPAVEEETELVETDQEEVKTETWTDEPKTQEENKVVEVLRNDFNLLKNDFETLRNTLETLKSENEALKEENKALKNTDKVKQKQNILDNAPKITTWTDGVKSIEDLKNKYRKI